MKSFSLHFEIKKKDDIFLCYCWYEDVEGKTQKLISQGRTQTESILTMFMTLTGKTQTDLEKGRIPFRMNEKEARHFSAT